LHGRCHHLGASRRAPGLGGAVEGQPAPGEQLEAVCPPAAWNERQPRTAGSAEEQLDGSVWLPGLEQDTGEPRRGPRCDKAFVEVAGEFDALLCGGQREVQIAGGECDDGPVEEVPSKRRRRPKQTPGLDDTVQELGSLGQLAAHVPDPGQDRVEAVQGIPLPARASETESATRVRVGFGVKVQIDLGDSEPARRVGTERELLVRQLIHERGGVGMLGSSGLGRAGHDLSERGHDGRRGNEGGTSHFFRCPHRGRLGTPAATSPDG
jgi:hypothetical protein